MMPVWVVAQVQSPQFNIVQWILEGLSANPSLVTLGLALLVFYFATRGMRDELRDGRKMLNSAQESLNASRKAGDDQENKALDMATRTIDKVDRLADSLNNMADAQRESGKDTLAGMTKLADAHIETTKMLVRRIIKMENKRSEDEIYANEALRRQINEQLLQSQEVIGRTVGTILAEAHALHEGTRRAVAQNNEVLMAALRSTPPAPEPPPDKSDSQTE